MISHQQMHEVFRKAVERSTVAKLSHELGFSPSYLRFVLNRQVPVGANLAAKLGYKKIEQEPMFEKIKESK